MICAVVSGPDRDRPAAHGPGRKWTEIAAVEAVGDIPVQQENLAAFEYPAALPDGQFAAHAVTCPGLGDLSAIDGDDAAGPANRLARQCCDMLQQQHPGAEIAALRQEAGQGFGWGDDDQVTEGGLRARVQQIKPGRYAGAHVPDQPRCDVGTCRARDGKQRDAGGEDITAAHHGAARRRLSHAACCAFV